MKQLFYTLLLFCFAGALQAQNVSDEVRQLAQTVTDELADVYNLDDRQTAEMYRIQVRKYNNLQVIEGMRNDRDLYVKKMQALQTGTDGSIKLILEREQYATHQERLGNRRKARAIQTKILTERGLSQEEIELELLKVE